MLGHGAHLPALVGDLDLRARPQVLLVDLCEATLDEGFRMPAGAGPLVLDLQQFRDLGEKRLTQLYKLMTMSSADFLDEWFETDVLKATRSASGIIGTFLGPRSPGSARRSS